MGKATALDDKGARRLMVVIAEVKDIDRSRYGHKIVFKHVPDCAFMVNDDMYTRMNKRFEVELGLWDALEDTHLMAIGTFGVGATGIAAMEEIAFMTVTSNWIPFESNYDKQLIDTMTHAQRRFMKGLRYNLSEKLPLACLVASDTLPTPTAMYIEPPIASEDYRKALDALIGESKLSSSVWTAAHGHMPALPEIA
jgi:hypothetical protein